MEGPSLFLAQEQLQPFSGKKILRVHGTSEIDKKLFLNKKVLDIFSWGKHLVFQFDTFGFRVHFMLFGTYEATVNGEVFYGDYKKRNTPKLVFEFENGKFEMFDCAFKIIEGDKVENFYDFSLDLMSKKFDPDAAVQKMELSPQLEIGDVLLDQDIFAGLGNKIKNESLWINKVHPTRKVESLSATKLRKLVDTIMTFTQQFYVQRKIDKVEDILQIYRKEHCPTCGTEVVKERTGKTQRWSYYCPVCQT